MASTTMAMAGPTLRPCKVQQQFRHSARTPVSCRAVVRPVAQQQTQQHKAALAAGVSALSITLAPAAMAAQEAMIVAEGEDPLVQVAWAALCVSFSASLAFVVWGRSGL